MTTVAHNAKPAAPAITPAPPRMSLAGVRSSRDLEEPLRILVFGTEGVGKSSLAADAPAPIFLAAEDGLSTLDVQVFPRPPERWQDANDAVMLLIQEAHPYKTIVVDTVDWLEPLIWRHVCAAGGMKTIEDFGFGKGYGMALDEWRQFLSLLERLQREKRMHVILLGHSQIRTFKNPEGEDYDRYTLKVHDKAGGLLREWTKDVLFANYETYADKDARTKKVKGISTGARMLHTNRTAAYDAKNRHGLPDRLPLNFGDLWAAMKAHAPADPEKLKEAIAAACQVLGDAAVTEAVCAKVLKIGDDAGRLAKVLDHLNGKITQKGV